MQKKAFYFDSPIGRLFIAEKNGKLCKISSEKSSKKNDFILEQTPLLKETEIQLKEYFEGERKTFFLPIIFEGTDFQIKVWQELTKIPYGQTLSYGDIAAKIGNKKATRAVGSACNKNKILLVAPCHRVIGVNGKMAGFACGINKKRFLLDLENSAKP